MRKSLPLILLVNALSVKASLVGVMDSGTDLTHKEIVKKVYHNPLEKPGTVDLDGDGLPGDVNGWDYTTSNSYPFDAQYVNLLTPEIIKFFAVQGKIENKTATDDELNFMNNYKDNQDFLKKADFLGGYIHGTHVSGTSLYKNNNAKIISYKMIPTKFASFRENTLAVIPGPFKQFKKIVHDRLTPRTFDDFLADVKSDAVDRIANLSNMDLVVAKNKVDVVNQSFGIGTLDVVKIFGNAYAQEFGVQLEKDQMMIVLRQFFSTIISNGQSAYNTAPNTVFVVAAGNDGLNVDRLPDYPSSIPASNKIVVAAAIDNTALANFSNYGEGTVDVAAPGVNILSTAPGQRYIVLSGTSQAAPYVTNVISLEKDANPALKALELKRILLETVDVKDWLDKKVRTKGLVNKERALMAATLSKTMSLDNAIAEAKTKVKDAETLAKQAPSAIGLSEFRSREKVIQNYLDQGGPRLKPYRFSLLLEK